MIHLNSESTFSKIDFCLLFLPFHLASSQSSALIQSCFSVQLLSRCSATLVNYLTAPRLKYSTYLQGRWTMHSISIKSPPPHLSGLVSEWQYCRIISEEKRVTLFAWPFGQHQQLQLRNRETFLALPKRTGKINPYLLDHHGYHAIISGHSGRFALRGLYTNSILAHHAVGKFYTAVCCETVSIISGRKKNSLP